MIIGSRSSGYSYISPEIVSLFLKSFPVKTLLQYRSVCKTWKQVIDSPWFALDHLSLQTTPRVLLQRQRICYLEPSGKYDEFEYILPDADNGGFYDTIRGPDGEHSFLSHAGCCVHGVLCFFYSDIKEMVLYNPSIRRQLRIPVPESCLPGGHRKTNSCGFWMDPCTKEFKVVLLSALRGRIAVYSSSRRKKEKEWAESDATSLLSLEFYPCSQVLVERVAYWAAASQSAGVNDNVLLYYDFADDRLGMIEFPVGCSEKTELGDPRKSCVTITKCRGSLEMIYLASGHPDEVYRVYVMTSGCWIARQTIRSSNCISQIIHVPLKGDGPVLAASRSFRGELAVYHPQHKRATPLRPRNPSDDQDDDDSDDEYSAMRYLITTASSEFLQTLVTPYQD